MTNQSNHLCNKCILPNTCDLIPFDSDGTCVLCKTAQSILKAAPERCFYDEQAHLNRIEEVRQKGKGKPYDCVVGVSGGRDSTYLLYLLTQKHNLRCLAMYYRTPFTADVIDQNIRRIVKELGADFEEIQLSQDYHRQIAREMIMLWKKNQHPLIINMACAPCKLLNREILDATHKHGVPTIMYGTNIYEAVQIAAGVSNKQVLLGDSTKLFTVVSKAENMFSQLWNGLKLLISTPTLWKYLILGIKASVMYISPNTLYLGLKYPNIKTVDYFFGSFWDENDCDETIKKLGWQRPSSSNSNWKADCCFAEIKNR